MSSSQMAISSENLADVPPRYRVAGLVGCVGALILIRMPLSASLRFVAFGHRRTTRAASPTEAAKAVRATRAAGRLLPVRFACLEGALASTLACLLLRRRVEWCIGGRLMPYAAHSWVEVDGAPVEEPGFADRPSMVLVRT